MDETDDIKELERMLGHTRPHYAALRHEGVLQLGRAAPSQRRPLRRYAAAAMILLAAGFSGLVAVDFLSPQNSTRIPSSRLAMSLPSDLTPEVGASLRAQARMELAQRTVRVRIDMPPRPTAF